jgi:putative hemolysin
MRNMGLLEGLVAPADLLAAMAEQIASEQDEYPDPAFVQRREGSRLVSSNDAADAMGKRLGLSLPEDGDFATIAAFALWRQAYADHWPGVCCSRGWRFEIVDPERRRIDKIVVSPEQTPILGGDHEANIQLEARSPSFAPAGDLR